MYLKSPLISDQKLVATCGNLMDRTHKYLVIGSPSFFPGASTTLANVRNFVCTINFPADSDISGVTVFREQMAHVFGHN